MKLDRTLAVVTLATTALIVIATGCGGSGGPESSVNGCEIQAGTSCPGADLSSADLASADLSGADLSTATLEGTNLSGANLTKANLSGAQIVDTDLSDADLTGANLTGATITGANLAGATLCGTIRTDGTTDDTSCPPPSTDTTDTTSVDAEVTTFVVGDLMCPEDSSDGSITVSWTTENATAAELGVDGETVSDEGPSGSAEIQVPCDGEPHDVSVTALSDAGAGESASEDVSSE
ncbi:MAG: pentapeptide repeat-containing protein [Thermoleophilia bacterium]|nr:pentapeptide repeat-containing protein [Thermoleophilia bacterium]